MDLELNRLSAAQRAAVCYHGDKHCLILAGAGSGKTRVLTHRIAWLILNQGLSPASILAITFTNRAAREMRERTEALLGGKGMTAGLQLMTFHAFGASFLRRYAAYAGLSSSFTIYAETEQKALLKLILNDLPERQVEGETRASLVRQLASNISGHKDAGLSPQVIAQRAITAAEEYEAKVFERYELELKANNAVDFADLLGLPLMILRNNPNVCERFHQQYQHILVDEFQDTNALQLALLKQMQGPNNKLTVVGDDDQSIYAWRGADASGILKFSEMFGPCESFKLEQNYRSSKAILACASKLIAHNVVRNEKELWTAEEGGAPVRILEYASDREEASDIAGRIAKNLAQRDMKAKDHAILYRKNSQSINFETALTRQSIPYQVIGSVSFFEREEIVDLMTYLRLLVNPVDMVGLRRVINKPTRHIGPKLTERIIELISEKAEAGTAPAQCLILTLQDIVEKRVRIPRGGVKFIEGCREVLELLEKTAAWQTRPPRETLELVIEVTGFDAHLQKSVVKKNQSYEEARERVDQLVGILDEYQERHPNDLPRFIEEMALVRAEADGSQDSVKLMTMHAAKGLEFDTVYVTGLEACILPLERGGECDIEEERRLMYVAMTRAKRHLFITYAQRRYEFGHVLEHEASPFLDELMPKQVNEAICVFEQLRSEKPAYRGTKPSLAWSQPQKQKKNKSREEALNAGFFEEEDAQATRFGRRKGGQDREENHFAAAYVEPTFDVLSDVEDLPKPKRSASAYMEVKGLEEASAKSKNGYDIIVGSYVNHSVHGRGVALRLEAAGKEVKVLVDFNKAGERTIIARFLESLLYKPDA